MLIRSDCFVRLLPWAALVFAAVPACRKAEIRTYVAPRDKEVVRAATGADEGGAAGEQPAAERAALPAVTWALPSGWTDLGSDGGMNVGQFKAGEVMVNITPLASMEGQENMLVNMWRNVLGQPAFSEAEATAALKETEIAGGKGRFFDLSAERGGSPVRIVTAFLHREGRSWFFKLQGPPDAVGAQLEAFTGFLKTVKFGAAGAAGPVKEETPAVAPAAAPEQPAAVAEQPAVAPAGASAPEGGEIVVPGKVPEGWRVVAAGAMQVAKYSVDGGAEVAVSVFPSDTGGLASNVLRWRRQIGLPEVGAEEAVGAAKPIDGGPEGAVVVDLENGEKALGGAIVPRGGRWFFYKLTGPTAAVKAARETFVNFAKATP